MPGFHHVEHVMGMAITIDVHDDDVSELPALADAIDWFHHVDETFSTYRSDSPISLLGCGELHLDQVTDEVRDVLFACEEVRLATDGAFDAFAVPAPNGTLLDPSGYVKGWSVECAAEILEANGARHFCLNAGGDIVLRGAPLPGARWRVGIRDPDDPLRLCAVLPLSGPWGVATSGSYERGAHLIDPTTGEPTTELASVTILGPDLRLADAYATAVYVKGLDGLSWLDRQSDYEGLIVTHDRRRHATAGMWELLRQTEAT